MSRSATMVAPRRGRQAAYAVLRAVVPPRWLLTRGNPEGATVCLTFDDGPEPPATPALLSLLSALEVRATFFVRGDRAAAHPLLIRQMRDGGHAIGHHSWSHSAPALTSAWRLAREARRTGDLLHQIAGVRTRWFRPPHGRVTAAKLATLWALGQTVVLWNTDPGDVFQPSAAALRDWFSRHPLQGGDLVLLHERSPWLPEVLPEVIADARRRGLRFGTVAELTSGPGGLCQRLVRA